MHYESTRRKRERERGRDINKRNNGWKLLNLDDRHEWKHSRASRYIQHLQTQRWRESWEQQEKEDITYRNSHSRFLIGNLRGQEAVGWYIQSTERKKTCQSRILYLGKLSFENEGGIKIFPDKQKLRVHHHWISPTRNIKGSPSGWNERTVPQTYEEIKISGKGKYIGNYKHIQYYWNFCL